MIEDCLVCQERIYKLGMRYKVRRGKWAVLCSKKDCSKLFNRIDKHIRNRLSSRSVRINKLKRFMDKDIEHFSKSRTPLNKSKVFYLKRIRKELGGVDYHKNKSD